MLDEVRRCGTRISVFQFGGKMKALYAMGIFISAVRRGRLQRTLSQGRFPCFALLLFAFVNAAGALGQEQIGGLAQVASPQQEHAHSEEATSLQDLLAEAERNNPQVEAARQTWEAAKQVPSQVSTLPDPQFTLQQLNVGSPRPFAGYTNSDFAYIGIGVSQDIPYPGKLRLKGEMAKRDANATEQQYESVRRAILAGVKSAYFQLAYLSKTLT